MFINFVKSVFSSFILSLVQFVSKLVGGKNQSANEAIKKSIKDIPGPLALPFFGTMLTSNQLRAQFIRTADDERMRLYGPIVKEEFLKRFPIINILSSDHIEIILKNFGTTRPGFQFVMDYRRSNPGKYDSVGLTSATGKEWDRLHAATAPLLSPALVKSMTCESDKMAKNFCDILKNLGPTFPNVKDVLKLYVGEVALLNVFGKRMGYLDNKDGKIADHLERFLDIQKEYWLALKKDKFKYFRGLFPWLKKFSLFQQKIGPEEDSLLEFIDGLTKDAMEDVNSKRPGLMHALLFENDYSLSYNDKRLLGMELVLGTGDTVLATVICFLYAVSSNNSIMENLFNEIKTVLRNKDSDMDAEELNRLPYLKGCFMEALRLYPVAPFIARVMEKECVVGGYVLPKGTLTSSHWAYAVRQPDAFYKPDEFLPERWIYDEDNHGSPPFTPHKRQLVIPFGAGKRMCPGNRVIKQHLSILFARIVRNFHISFETPIAIKHEWFSQPIDPVQVTFKERQE